MVTKSLSPYAFLFGTTFCVPFMMLAKTGASLIKTYGTTEFSSAFVEKCSTLTTVGSFAFWVSARSVNVNLMASLSG